MYWTIPTRFKVITGSGVKATVPLNPYALPIDEGYRKTDIQIGESAFNTDDNLWFYRDSAGISERPNIFSGPGAIFDTSANYTITGQWNFAKTPTVNAVPVLLKNQFDDMFEKVSDGVGGYYIRAKYTLASDYNLVAFADSGQAIPSIWDSIPIASPTQLGVVKVGNTLSIANGVLNIANGVGFDLAASYSPTGQWNFTQTPKVGGVAVSLTNHTHSYEPLITKATGYAKWTGSAWAFVNESYYTQTQVNNFFAGTTAITGYNKTNWDGANALLNDLFEKVSDGQGGYYIRAKYTLASDYNLVAFADSGQSLPSIFDNLPVASATQLGVIKVGTSLSISGGVLNVSPTYIGGVNEAEVNAIIAAKVNVANGLAGLDSGAKLPVSLFPDSMLGQVSYQGTWNASTNTPTLPTTPPAKGHYYVVSVAGTQFGIEFQVGDWIISNGTAWQKVDNSDAVMTVFGRLGNVVANAADYTSFYLRHDTASQGLTSTQKSNARVNLGATTIGTSMFTLTNPSTLAYPQFNGDNTVTALSAAGMRSALDVAQKQNSTTDTTSGRGMIVGAFGLGNTSTAPSITDYKNYYPSGFFLNPGTAADRPYAYASTIVNRYDSDIQHYLSFNVATEGSIADIRTSQLRNGVLSPWVTLYHTGNANLSTVDWNTKNLYTYGAVRFNLSAGNTVQINGIGSDTIVQGPNLYFNDAGTTATATVLQQASGGGFDIWTYNNGWGRRLHINKNGNTGINQTSPAYTLDVGGTLRCSSRLYASTDVAIGKTTVASGYVLDTNGSVMVNGNLVATGDIIAFSSSDRRLKRDIKPIVNGLELVEQLNPVTYKWNKKAKELFNADVNKNNFGLIAQELAEIIPELTGEMHGGKSMGVNYTPIINILIAAVKELNKKMEEIR